MLRLRQFIDRAGWPRIIIRLLLLSLFVVAPSVGVRIDASLMAPIIRFGMNGVLMLATYVRFSSVSFMSIMWMVLHYHSPTMIWGYSGEDLRTTISVDWFWSK